MSVSYFDNVPFIRDITPYKDKDRKVLNYSNLVKREDALQALNSVLIDIKKAIYLEAGIFEFALIYLMDKRLDPTLFPLIYTDKLQDIMTNMTLNPNLVKQMHIMDNTNCQQIPFATPEQLYPENWAEYNKKKEWKEYKQKNFAATDLYKCFKCGEKKCQVRLLQTRSADEPMTNFITCLVCGHTFKK